MNSPLLTPLTSRALLTLGVSTSIIGLNRNWNEAVAVLSLWFWCLVHLIFIFSSPLYLLSNSHSKPAGIAIVRPRRLPQLLREKIINCQKANCQKHGKNPGEHENVKLEQFILDCIFLPILFLSSLYATQPSRQSTTDVFQEGWGSKFKTISKLLDGAYLCLKIWPVSFSLRGRS